LLLWRQFDLNFPSHCLRYLPLHRQRVANFALDSKTLIYGETGKLVVADEHEIREWRKIGVRKLMRATKLTQKAIYSILSGKGVRAQTMAIFRAARVFTQKANYQSPLDFRQADNQEVTATNASFQSTAECSLIDFLQQNPLLPVAAMA
jgi:hypothetical protein